MASAPVPWASYQIPTACPPSPAADIKALKDDVAGITASLADAQAQVLGAAAQQARYQATLDALAAVVAPAAAAVAAAATDGGAPPTAEAQGAAAPGGAAAADAVVAKIAAAALDAGGVAGSGELLGVAYYDEAARDAGSHPHGHDDDGGLEAHRRHLAAGHFDFEVAAGGAYSGELWGGAAGTGLESAGGSAPHGPGTPLAGTGAAAGGAWPAGGGKAAAEAPAPAAQSLTKRRSSSGGGMRGVARAVGAALGGRHAWGSAASARGATERAAQGAAANAAPGGGGGGRRSRPPSVGSDGRRQLSPREVSSVLSVLRQMGMREH
jgi:hypothetical protein